MAVCDADLIHTSHISDEEDLRFQLGVAVYGTELGQHGGGRAFRWGPQPVHLRQGVRLRLVNVGAASIVGNSSQGSSASGTPAAGSDANGNTAREGRRAQLGYPVCTVCGQSVSPLSSDRQRDTFRETHTERCGRVPEGIGFHADVTADVLSLPACESAETAYSVLETLRIGAAQVLDMHLDDLQILVIGHVDRDEVDALLWDPMPGGSGLLDQLCEHVSRRSSKWPEEWPARAPADASPPASIAWRRSATPTITGISIAAALTNGSTNGDGSSHSTIRYRGNNRTRRPESTRLPSTTPRSSCVTCCSPPGSARACEATRSASAARWAPPRRTWSIARRTTIPTRGSASTSTG